MGLVSALREWWKGTSRGLGLLGTAVFLSTLSIPGIVRHLADQTQATTIFTAVSTMLPPTAAAAIISYRAYRKLSLSPAFIAGTFVGTAAVTAALGIAGGGAVREAFINVRTAPASCYQVQGISACLPGAATYDTPTSLPELLFRLVKLYWILWGISGIATAIAVGWFLGWFFARRVVDVIAKRKSQPPNASSPSPPPEPGDAATESRCERCGAGLARAARFCSACGQATPTT
jgi:hypothetical protein